MKLTAVSNNSKSNECAYRLFIESSNCSLGPCLSQETIEGSDQANWFANAGGAMKQQGLPVPGWYESFPKCAPIPLGLSGPRVRWSMVSLLREHSLSSQVTLFLNYCFYRLPSLDDKLVSGGKGVEKELRRFSKISDKSM